MQHENQLFYIWSCNFIFNKFHPRSINIAVVGCKDPPCRNNYLRTTTLLKVTIIDFHPTPKFISEVGHP